MRKLKQFLVVIMILGVLDVIGIGLTAVLGQGASDQTSAAASPIDARPDTRLRRR